MKKHLAAAVAGVGLLALGFSLGCGEESVDPTPNGGGGAGSGGEPAAGGQGGTPSTGGGGGQDEGGFGGMAPVEVPIQNIAGDLVWSVTFDDAAHTAGAIDCTYTRHYEAVEDESAKWICPTCDVIFKADVEMTQGLEDCYSQVSADPPLTTEWIGFGGGRFWRSIGITASDQGSAAMDADAVTTANTVMDLPAMAGGTMAFDVAGSLTIGSETGDPLHGFYTPSHYDCGWSKTEAAPYTGDYTVAKGQTVPDGIFMDKCEQAVRLHELKGSYMIIDMAARDCPPCRSMAGEEEAFIADMKDNQGIDVKVVTLLAPSLAEPLADTTTFMLDQWTTQFDLSSPILADRGWGLSMFIPIFGDQVGYPAWVIVDPDLKVVETGVGFGSTDDFKTIILADAN